MSKRHEHACPVAAFLNVFGDAWTLMVIREAFYGATQFSEIQRNTGIAKNLLSARLSMLVEEGVLYREDIGERGSRYAYKLTEKGKSLVPVLVAMVQWANEHLFSEGTEPVFLVERKSGKPLKRLIPSNARGRALKWGDILARPGPGADRATRARILSGNPRAEGAGRKSSA